MDGQVDFTATGEVLDVTVAAVFGPARDRASTLLADLFFGGIICGAGVDVLGLGWFGDDAPNVLEAADEFAFAFVPCCENFGGGSAAEDTGVD